MTKRKDKKAPIKISAEETKKETINEQVSPEDEVIIEQANADTNADEIVVEESENVEEVVDNEQINTQNNVEKAIYQDKKSKSTDKKDAKIKKKKDKSEKRGLKRRTKETVSELKKVVWPTFPEVVKKTGVVIAVVLIFAVVLLCLDLLLGLASSALMGKPFVPFS